MKRLLFSMLQILRECGSGRHEEVQSVWMAVTLLVDSPGIEQRRVRKCRVNIGCAIRWACRHEGRKSPTHHVCSHKTKLVRPLFVLFSSPVLPLLLAKYLSLSAKHAA